MLFSIQQENASPIFSIQLDYMRYPIAKFFLEKNKTLSGYNVISDYIVVNSKIMEKLNKRILTTASLPQNDLHENKEIKRKCQHKSSQKEVEHIST